MYRTAITTLLLAPFIACPFAVGQQTTASMSIFAKLEAQSKRTDAANAQAVADLVHLTLSRSIFSSVAGDLEAQLQQAQTAYLNDKSPGVTDDSMVEAINDTGTRLAFPNFTKTNRQQVFVFRMLLLPAMPDFLGVRVAGSSSSTSPLAAWFLCSLLLEQKLSNPDFQRDANAWSSDALARKAGHSEPNAHPRLVGSASGEMHTESRQFRAALNRQLENNAPPQASAVHDFAARFMSMAPNR